MIMFEINEVKTIFIIAVLCSLFSLIYDIVMTKTKLYKKLLRKAPPMPGKKYHGLIILT